MGVKVLSFLTVEKQSEPLALRPSPPNHSEGRTNFHRPRRPPPPRAFMRSHAGMPSLVFLKGRNKNGSLRLPDLSEHSLMTARGRGGRTLRTWVFNPLSHTRSNWDVLTLVFMLYQIVIVPFRLCFNVEPKVFYSAWWFEAFVEWFFIFDILVNFNTGVQAKDGTISMDRRQIAHQYVKSWFVVDVLSSVPTDFILGLAGFHAIYAQKLIRILRLIKATKIIRMFTITHKLDLITDAYPALPVVTGKLFFMLFCTLYLGHCCACVWYLIGRTVWCDPATPDCVPTWLYHQDPPLYPPEDIIYDGSNESAAVIRAYIASMYWAYCTLTTVGYGDIVANANLERVFAFCTMILGNYFFGFVISGVASLASTLDTSSEMQAKMIQLSSYLRKHHVPNRLARRVRRYFKYKWTHESVGDATFVGELSDGLRTELLHHVHVQVARRIHLFQHVCRHYSRGCPLDAPHHAIRHIIHHMRMFCSPSSRSCV